MNVYVQVIKTVFIKWYEEKGEKDRRESMTELTNNVLKPPGVRHTPLQVSQ